MGGFMNKKKLFALATGFRGRAKNCYRLAYRRVEKALQHAYVGRKLKKRQYRSVWISRINAASRQYDMSYSNFIHGLQKSDIQLNRKMLAQMAIYEPFSFRAIVQAVHKETKVPLRQPNTFGLLQTAVTADRRQTKTQPLHFWSQVPIMAGLRSAELRQ